MVAESRAVCEDGILVRWQRFVLDGVLRDWNTLKSIYVVTVSTGTGESFSTSIISMDVTYACTVACRASDRVNIGRALILCQNLAARCPDRDEAETLAQRGLSFLEK